MIIFYGGNIVKQRTFFILMILMLCLALVSCGSGPDEDNASPAQTETPNGEQATDAGLSQESPAEEDETGGAGDPAEASGADATDVDSENTDVPPESDLADIEFSFQIGEQSLTLLESGIDNKLAELPFEFVSDTTEELGEGSDTFSGSFLRTVKYEGLELLLFAPKDNKEHFWVMQMTAAQPGIFTYRGVQPGDPVDLLLEKYPEAELIPTDDELVVYRYVGSEFEELSFVLSDDTVSQILLTYYMP